MISNKFCIYHETSYTYAHPVQIFPHEIRLRPRDGSGLDVFSFDLTVEPDAEIRWLEDPFGNRVARILFADLADRLVIKAQSELVLNAEPWPVFDIAPHAQEWPFDYRKDTLQLTPFIEPVFKASKPILEARLQGVRSDAPLDTLTLLQDLNRQISQHFIYQVRDTEGTQTPTQTLVRGMGTCRDFAVLFAEYARTLGFAARLVSGYLIDPEAAFSEPDASTHAWSEVYLPNAGWIAFDPTHGRMGSYGLVALAVGRKMDNISPITGAIGGPSGEPVMTVKITYGTMAASTNDALALP
ncbi:transglutaminase family protein [Asticcacaulis sp. AND118]|uniref:transglutaminase family protein n=1 Tax=Asticcacaulis sp. AND118 TaxID=2840468 RepID=UPI001CFFF6C1|nr:transglutaminase family protein [Asticcacaulis sp. AND118]UDF05575.1 transglutaminase family protein [Asticcacaulis sp. AND118]